MAEMNAINHKSWLTWLGKALLAVAIIMVLSTVHGSSAMALSHIGPSSPGDRYSMTRDSTHTYEELHVPVYFKDNPGSVRVFVEDTKWRGGAYFNGTLIYGPGGEFTVSGFQYDKETGYWKSMIIAHMASKLMFQFRLRLERTDGIIAYAKGAASQASNHYNNDMDDLLGPFETKEMQMALPCSFTQPTRIGPNTPYHFILYDLDTWYPEWHETKKHNNKWWHNNGMSTINVRVIDENTNEVVAEYKGKDYQCGRRGEGVREGPQCMGENGVLDIGMVMLPGHKYKTLIGPTWKNNLIEYELPFDNIFYNISCEPKVDMRTTVDFTKKPTGDPKKPRTGYKQLSSYGKYNSNEGKGNGNNSIAEVMGYPGGYHFKKWEGISPQDSGSLPKAIMDSDKLQGHGGELYPGDVLTWWFRAYNSSGYIVPEEMKMDFTNLREGWIDPRLPGQSWNQPEPKPEEGSNWFRPADRGGPLNGSDHRQITWGCYNWGGKCTDYRKGFDPSNLNEGVSISEQEAVARHYRYEVKSGDAGQTLCQWLRMSWNYNGWKQRLTPKACVYIPYHYPGCPEGDPSCTPNNCTMRGDCPGGTPVKRGVKPSVSAQPATVEAGGTATFTYNLNNAGPTKSKDLHYQAYTFILRSGAGLPDNSPRTVAYPMSWGAVGCGGRHVGWGSYRDGKCAGGVSGNTVVYPGEDVKMTRQYRVADLGAERWLAQPGDKICSYLALDQMWNVYNDVDSRTFVASNIACVTITKKPSLQLIGSDSYAKDGFTGSDVRENIVPGTDKRGSYSQYGLLTGGTKVTNFGSAGYTTASKNNHSLACKLSYANTGNVKDDCKDLKGLLPAGLLKKPLSMPSSTNATPLPGGSNVDLGGLQSGNYKAGSGSLRIWGDLGKGQHITIFAEQADVTITGNIDAYAGPYAKLSDIPSFTIMAKNIKVNPGVSLITGTYVAKGHFESCNNGAQEKGPTLGVEGVCKNKLKVNGAIVSGNSPIFRRTFGAGNLPYDSQWDPSNISSTAEWINYTPNLWLTTSNGSSGDQLEGLTTTQVTNLPVRY